MRYLLLLIFLASCQTTEKAPICPGPKMVGWASPAEMDDMDKWQFETAKATCYVNHKPYVCLYRLTKLKKKNPKDHGYTAICGLPRNPSDE